MVTALAFSPDSQKLVSGSADNTAIIWDITQQRQLQQLKGHSDPIYAVAFSADNQRVITGSFDHTLILWQVATGKRQATLQGHTDKVQALAISPKGDLIASGSNDHSIRLWNARTGKFIRTLANQGTQIGSLSFSANGRQLLSSCGGPSCANNPEILWDIESGKALQRYSQHNNIVLATAVSPTGKVVATAGGANNEIHLWNPRTGKRLKTLAGQGAAVWSVGFSAKGNRIAWGKKSNYKSINNRGELQYQLTLSQSQHSLGTPRTLKDKHWQRAQTQQGQWSLATRKGGNYGVQALLDIHYQGKPKASIERGSSDGYDHRAYTFTPNGKQIISGGANGVLSLYNRQGTRQGQFIGHTGDIWAVAVSPNGRTLISGSGDQTLRLWNIQSQELVLTLFTGEQGQWVAWTPQGYYNASPQGDQLLGWQINRGADQAAGYASAKQLRQHFYRPDIIDSSLRLASARQAVAQASNTEFQLADLLKKGLPPQFTLHQPHNGATVTQQQQNIILSFSQNTKADSLEAYVNGVQVLSRGKMALPRPRKGQPATQRRLTLPLKTGKNAIRIVASNHVGQTEHHFILNYRGRQQSK